jgi:hypothetical protein
MNNMKRNIFLGVGLAALYLAAREHGINSLEDLRNFAKPYLKYLDPENLGLQEEEGSSASASSTSGGNSSSGNSRSQRTPVTHES